MTPVQIFGVCALLVGLVVFGARLCVDSDPIDVLTLVALSLAVGYMGNML